MSPVSLILHIKSTVKSCPQLLDIADTLATSFEVYIRDIATLAVLRVTSVTYIQLFWEVPTAGHARKLGGYCMSPFIFIPIHVIKVKVGLIKTCGRKDKSTTYFFSFKFTISFPSQTKATRNRLCKCFFPWSLVV